MWILLSESPTYRNVLLFIYAVMGLDVDLPKFKKG